MEYKMCFPIYIEDKMINKQLVIKCKYDKLIELDDLRPHPDNENKHSDKQIEVLRDIILKDGMRHPIIVSNLSGYIVAGHGRLMALMRYKLDNLIDVVYAPVEFQDFDDPIQELRVRTADNQIARYAEFQTDQFKLNLQKVDLKIEDVNPQEFGLIDFPLNINLIDINNGDVNYGDKNKEIDTENFGNDLQHCCPKCGFEFNE